MRLRRIGLLAVIIMAIITSALADSGESISIIWSPPRAGEGRMFRVLVHHTGRVVCTTGSELALLDRTPTDSTGPDHRFYFRAVAPGHAARIAFVDPEDETARADTAVQIIAERDWSSDTATGNVALPRIWPMDRRTIGLKTRRTLVPDRRIGHDPDHAAPEALSWTDEAVWNLVLPCDIPRWHFMNLRHGCPIHGRQVFERDAYYPWLVEPLERPYHIQCPVGGEWFPSNDYAAGDFTSGDYPDDGLGYEQDGLKFGMTSYALQRRIRYTYSVARQLSNHYEATGDVATAHKLAVILCAIAREHRYLCCFLEHRYQRYQQTVAGPKYRRNRQEYSLGAELITDPADLTGSGLDDYCINMPKHYNMLTRAYDLIFDRIEDDTALVAFVAERMPWLRTRHDVRTFLEVNLLRAGIQGALDNAIASNLPRPQESMLKLIRVLDQPEGRELVDWLLHGGGQVAAMPVNFHYKDGGAYESVGGYNGIHVSELMPLALGLRDLARDNPDRYPPDRYDILAGSDRLYNILRWPLDIVVAQRSCPLIGDEGNPPQAEVLLPLPMMDTGRDIQNMEVATELFPEEERFSTALTSLRAVREYRALVRANPDTVVPEPQCDSSLFQPSRLLDGYGVGILESGEGDARRGVWLYYGDHPHHAHDQRLDMGLVAHKRNLLRHMGYPYSWEHTGNWDANWVTHYGVKLMVPDSVVRVRNTVRFFHGAEPFQIVEALGYGISVRRSDEGYMEVPGFRVRRALSLVDLPDGRFYVVDMFRAESGTSHWWTFHGPPGEMTTNCDDRLVPQETGTAAGPDIAYGEETPTNIPRSLSNLYDARRGDVPVPFSATWTVQNAGALKLRMTQVAPTEGEFIVARGRSPHAPAENPPYELDWILRKRLGETYAQDGELLDSEFITVIESDSLLPLRNYRAIRVGDVSGVRVETDEVVHHVLRRYGNSSRSSSTETVEVDGIRFNGHAGFVETEKTSGRISRMTLVGSGSLTLNGRGITQGGEDWTGTIAALDPAGQTITIRSEQAPENLIGRYLIVHRIFTPRPDGDCYAYRVEDAIPAGQNLWQLRVNYPWVTAQGVVGRHTDVGLAMTGKLPLGRSRTFYRGSYLLNGNREHIVQILDAGREDGDESHVVFPTKARESMTERFPVGTPFTIEEIGVGDSVCVSGYTSVVRDGDAWRVNASGTYSTDLQ